eukprot:1050351-Heterocapsa_arctica.AAC.1
MLKFEGGEINIFILTTDTFTVITLPQMKKAYDIWPLPEVADKTGAYDANGQIVFLYYDLVNT